MEHIYARHNMCFQSQLSLRFPSQPLLGSVQKDHRLGSQYVATSAGRVMSLSRFSGRILMDQQSCSFFMFFHLEIARVTSSDATQLWEPLGLSWCKTLGWTTVHGKQPGHTWKTPREHAASVATCMAGRLDSPL